MWEQIVVKIKAACKSRKQDQSLDGDTIKEVFLHLEYLIKMGLHNNHIAESSLLDQSPD